MSDILSEDAKAEPATKARPIGSSAMDEVVATLKEQ
jgi:hypothetical protein